MAMAATGQIHEALMRPMIVPIGELVLDPTNARTHSRKNIEAIKGSLSQYLQRTPLVVHRETKVVIKGNGTLLAARELAWETIACILVDDDDLTRLGYSIADNRSGELASWDRTVLSEELVALAGAGVPIAAMGWDESDIAAIAWRGDGELPEEESADGGAPDVSGVAVGSAWMLGPHVVLCGDSTSRDSVEAAFRVAETDSAHQLLTDPPYGVAYGGKTGRTIANDQGQDYRAFFGSFLRLVPLTTPNTAYVFMGNQELHNLRLALDDAGFTWGAYLVWVKQQFVLGRTDYNVGHEFVIYAWKNRHRFYGEAGSTSVLSFDRPRVSEEHPTMKPTDLIARLIWDGCPGKGVVYDPFLGSGSTLIACEMTGRRCVGIELEPKYCAAAVRRWERFTGRSAERVS
jgi:DNA modification methylase